ncbi:MAG TPA: GNAT family N-acetyltransferase [Gemmatimonadaceae bacterium]|nr:GNAT family N-acetyltransferase [Gemmatimonadaceae bacterium]
MNTGQFRAITTETLISIDTFRTERLIAERLTLAHFDDMRAIDANAEVMATMGGVRTESQTRGNVEFNVAHWEHYGFGTWVLRDQNGNALAGRVKLRNLDLNGTAEIEIGYALLPQFWGRGLATEAVRACLQLGFGPIGAPSIVALVRPGNTKSEAVLARTRFTRERDVTHERLPYGLFRRPRPQGE